jgi:uncharacterized membrane protein
MSSPLSVSNPGGAKNLATLVYALHAAAFLTGGLTLLAAVLVNYCKRDVARGTWVEGHFTAQISTFWWTLLGNIISAATVFLLGLGYVVWLVVAAWLIYRIAKGWLRLIANEPM